MSEFLAKTLTNLIEQAPYSPNMAPCDFFLFPKSKLPLRGTHFESLETIKENSRRELKPILAAAYKKCMDNWTNRWRKYIAADYFEDDKINFDN